MDYVGQDYHHPSHSHIDASATSVSGARSTTASRLPATVMADGAAALSVKTLHEGLVGRGVLLDGPGVRERSWLEPGESVFRNDLEAAERAQGGDGRCRRCPARSDRIRAALGGAWGHEKIRIVAGSSPHRDDVRRGSPGSGARFGREQRHRTQHGPKAWRFRSTYSPSTGWACTFWTTWPSRNCERRARRRNDETSSSLPLPLRIPGGQARRSTRSRSCDMRHADAVWMHRQMKNR